MHCDRIENDDGKDSLQDVVSVVDKEMEARPKHNGKARHIAHPADGEDDVDKDPGPLVFEELEQEPCNLKNKAEGRDDDAPEVEASPALERNVDEDNQLERHPQANATKGRNKSYRCWAVFSSISMWFMTLYSGNTCCCVLT